MKLPRRRLLHLAAGAAGLPAVSRITWAQAYPSRPVRIISGFPPGYTLLLATSADAWNATLYDNLKFNFIRDVAAVAPISRAPGVLVVHPSLPSKSVPELIAYAKSNPGKISVASAGIGSAPHMYWELFRSLSGVDMVHVPYRGDRSAEITEQHQHIAT